MKADDGTELKALEGVVLDRDGQPVTRPHTTVRAFTFRAPLIGAIVALPLAMLAGVAIFGILAAFLVAFFILSVIASLFRGSRRPR